jgi:hypothetical protein
MPYNEANDFPRLDRLIKRINSDKPSFSIFIGDTKSGSSLCTNEHAAKMSSYFNSLQAPLIYSIGDNEWTDCHRPLAGAYDPLERLDALRSSFFNSNQSFGKKQLLLTRQGDIDPAFKKYVENAYWVKNHTLFVNLHIPGSNNNFERDEIAKAEYRERNLANLAWIKQMFALAKTALLPGAVSLASLIGMELKPGRDVSPCALVIMSLFPMTYPLSRGNNSRWLYRGPKISCMWQAISTSLPSGRPASSRQTQRYSLASISGLFSN